jgi:hypothetical protein
MGKGTIKGVSASRTTYEVLEEGYSAESSGVYPGAH